MDSKYFDYAATTPVDPRVLSEMLPYFSEDFGNASSLHTRGANARAAVELARHRIATAIGAEDPSQIVFTSGSTESNNIVLHSFRGQKVSVGPFEHSSVREPAEHLGFNFLVNVGEMLESPSEVQDLISVMTVNNETGIVIDPTFLRPHARYIHTDATQHLGKLPISVVGFDYLSASGHKIYGPKGVGFLYSNEITPEPLTFGGGHENGVRPGTLNVPAIVGLGLATQLAVEEQQARFDQAIELKELILNEIPTFGDVRANSGINCSPFILNLSFRGIQGESLLIDLDQAGFALSAGAACSSASTLPSPVLNAFGLESDWIRGTIRISFGMYNTRETAEALAKTMARSVRAIRST